MDWAAHKISTEITRLKRTVDEQARKIDELESRVSVLKCAKCRGTGQEYRGGDRGYMDCSACNGKGH